MNHDRARAALEPDLTQRRASRTMAPRQGWIRAIREALGMSVRELADRSELSPGRISQIERAEQERTLTLSTLERIARALDCDVEYVLIPRQPLDDMVRNQAIRKATELTAATDHTMALEDQRPSDDATRRRIETLAAELIDKRGLWS